LRGGGILRHVDAGHQQERLPLEELDICASSATGVVSPACDEDNRKHQRGDRGGQ